ncbi:uncharacterized protein AB675_6043 [Cyphellophora attinorum]|uniref:Uncharacterized protein n=1 Tax=Cyphellophora attinorum TaxID=1664694 RepID=A0A0N1HP13_9EURO|nr:uncharacterized protein AB675_6043 [Phialophora attinorum]KPI36903.1 hypothetical protein AB675_6043 [Phialophora attinorum]
MSTVSGFSVSQDREVAEYNRVRAILLARQEQRRQDLRRRLGMPARIEPYKQGWLKDFTGWRSKEEKYLDEILEEERKEKLKSSGAEDVEGEMDIKEALAVVVDEKEVGKGVAEKEVEREEARKAVMKGMRMGW